jgi:hypothetical protein
VNTQRALAVVSAILFVAAVGLATVGSEMITLGAALSYLSASGEVALHSWLVRVLGVWAWEYCARPLLVRPAWLPFGALGLIFAGIAMSWPTGDATRRSHRRS